MEQNPYQSPRVETATNFSRRRDGSCLLGVGSVVVGAGAMLVGHSVLDAYVSPHLLGELAGPFFIIYLLGIFSVVSVLTFLVGCKG